MFLKLLPSGLPVVILLPENYIVRLFCQSPLKAEMLKEEMKLYLGFFPLLRVYAIMY